MTSPSGEEPPVRCYAVIFSSLRRAEDERDYSAMAARMAALAAEQQGYLGAESTRDADGRGITVSYWRSREDIAAWKAQAEHRLAQELGRSRWYESFHLRVAAVIDERAWP